jgi:hypothetical protein
MCGVAATRQEMQSYCGNQQLMFKKSLDFQNKTLAMHAVAPAVLQYFAPHCTSKQAKINISS